MLRLFKHADLEAEAIKILNEMQKEFLEKDFPLRKTSLYTINFLKEVIHAAKHLNSEALGKAVSNAAFMDQLYAGKNKNTYPILRTILALQGVDLGQQGATFNKVVFLLLLARISIGIVGDMYYENKLANSVSYITNTASSFWQQLLNEDAEMDASVDFTTYHRLA